MSEQKGKRRGMFGRLFGRETSVEETGPEDAPKTPDEIQSHESAEHTSDVEAGTVTNDLSEGAVTDTHPRSGTEVAVTAVEEFSPVVASEAPTEPEKPTQQSWFQKLRSGLTKTSSRLSDGITGIFTKKKLDATTLEDLEDLLIQADLGVDTAMRITDTLSKGRYEKGIAPEDVRRVLAEEVERVLAPVAQTLELNASARPHVILVVGVNGAGKTTTIGKLAAKFAADGKKVMLAAGDTFRAAAIDQLKIWGERTGSPVIARDVGADSSGLAYDALKAAREGQYDVLIVDTAGRLQNKQALMDELVKVVRVLRKLDPDAPHDVTLVLDATTGQNAMQQVEVFRERAGVTALIMTKLDGTARGGILVSIASKFAIPVYAIGVGEGVEDLQPFDAAQFAKAIASM
ncbi:fused signal recognition particle receptor [Filomicrobium insigne]|uniref:Signal recognition particle receptor FtsY n=1 Tax=Filomicrobium insigne TaxID=418854 RepID=A0A1H0TWW0_9HYPH|nr:signal recognition particle-docking protein FtsY [Filomicrobium insigne]SDP58225.1 fused signal recognition particle receptor [Filomicrobium insigne]